MATWRLLTIPVDHCRSVTIFSYHCSVKPCGGKLRIRASVKLIGTITSIGASRYSTVSAPSAAIRIRRGWRQESLIA